VDAYPDASRPTAQIYLDESPNPFCKAMEASSRFNSFDPGLLMI
jgi:hypothetical protein